MLFFYDCFGEWGKGGKFVFWHFGYDISGHEFLWVYPVRVLLSFINLYVYVLCKIFRHYFLNVFFFFLNYPLCFLLLNSDSMKVRPLASYAILWGEQLCFFFFFSSIFSLLFKLDSFYWSKFRFPDSSFSHLRPAIESIRYILNFGFCVFQF